jgi:hypothetical protein
MIAPCEMMSKPVVERNFNGSTVYSESSESENCGFAELALRNSKTWVERNPTTVLVASIVLGLVAGYIVKRRR